MKRINWLVAGVALALSVSALAVVPGGFPFNPFFGVVTTSGAVNVGGALAGPVPSTVFTDYNTGAVQGRVMAVGPNTSTVPMLSLGVINSTGSTYCEAFRITSTAVTMPCATMTAVPWPKYATATFLTGGAACTSSINISSCPNNSTGTYTINFSAGFTVAPACSGAAFNADVVTLSTVSTTSAVIAVLDMSTHAGSNNPFTIMCIGK